MEQGEVNAAELQTALRRIIPFLSEAKEELRHVWVVVDGGEVRMTGGDGYQISQTWFEADWPNGEWLLDGEACKRLAQSADSMMTGDLPLEITDTAIKVNDMTIPVRGLTWLEFQPIMDKARGNMVAHALFSRAELMKFVRPKAAVLGFTLRGGKCFGVRKMDKEGDSRDIEETVPTQMVDGEAREAFDRTRLKRALDTFGPWVALWFQAGEKEPVILEGADQWHIIMPWSEYPIISELGKYEQATLKLAAEMIDSILKEELKANVDLFAGRLVIVWEPEPERTTVRSSQDSGVGDAEDESEEHPVPDGEGGNNGNLDSEATGGGGRPLASGAEVSDAAPDG